MFEALGNLMDEETDIGWQTTMEEKLRKRKLPCSKVAGGRQR